MRKILRKESFSLSRRRFLQVVGTSIVGGGAILDVIEAMTQVGLHAPAEMRKVSLPILTRRENEIIPESEILYKAYLVPAKADLLEMGFDQALAEKIIYRVIDGGETPVHAAKPIHYDLIELCKEARVKPSPLISTKLRTHSFSLLRFCCTFRSHVGSPHPYVWGEMKVTFSNLTGSEEAIAFDLCPSTVMDATRVQKEFGLAPSLEFKPIPITVSTGQIFRKVVEFTELTPIVTAFGKQSSVAGWEYQTSRSREDIRGNHEGFIILMFPKGAQIKVRVDVRVKVRENFLSKIRAISGKWKQRDFENRDMKEVVLPLYRAVPVTEEELDTKRWRPGFGDLIQGRPEITEDESSIKIGVDPNAEN